MALTPEEIRSTRFTTRLRGYDRREVTDFLSEVAGAHRDALDAAAGQQDAEELAAQLEHADAELLERSRQLDDAERRIAELEGELAGARSRAGDAEEHAAGLEQRLAAALREQSAAPDPYERLAEEVASVLRHAEEVAATVRERALADASEVQREARAEAESIRASARQLRDEIEAERSALLDRTRDEAQELLGAALAWHARLRDIERAVLDRFDDFFSSLQDAGEVLRGSSKDRVESAYELMVQMDMEKLEASLNPDPHDGGPPG